MPFTTTEEALDDIRIMRQMPQLLRAAGLGLIAAFPYVLADIGKADYWLASIES